jgi:hypothetical protein
MNKEMHMRKLIVLALIAAMAAVPGVAAAQATKGSNGGAVAKSDGHSIEFVRSGLDIIFYVSDHDGSPLPTKELKGRATIQDGGKTVTVPLTPATPNLMRGKLQAELSSKAIIVFSGNVHGHSLTARYTAE